MVKWAGGGGGRGSGAGFVFLAFPVLLASFVYSFLPKIRGRGGGPLP